MVGVKLFFVVTTCFLLSESRESPPPSSVDGAWKHPDQPLHKNRDTKRSIHAGNKPKPA